MRTIHEALGVVDSYSPAEQQFNRRRRTAGLVVAPLAAVAIGLTPMTGLSPEAHRLAAVATLVALLWITEALPLAVTALLGPALAVLLGVAPAREVLAPFADPVIFLFIGSFILAEAMFVHGLDRRIAYGALASGFASAGLSRLALVYAALAAAVSMWVSNVATTAMFFPVGLALIAHLSRSVTAGNASLPRFALGVMLLTSFAASIGGMGTPVGTPPNFIGISLLHTHAGVQLSFLKWMAVGLPVVICLFVFVMLYFQLVCFRRLDMPALSPELARGELERLGPLSRGQRNVLVAFAVTMLLWVGPGLLSLGGGPGAAWGRALAEAVPEGIAALIGAILLFVLPVEWKSRRFTMRWEDASRIDWGIIILYGGGLALGELAFSTGLAESVGRVLVQWLPVHTTFTLTVLFTGFSILVSEATSNTAAATMVVPIAIAVADSAGVRPLEPALGATLGASMGFMMPISTAPNAIVYSSGYVPFTAMLRHGAVLDLAALVFIVPAVILLGGWLF